MSGALKGRRVGSGFKGGGFCYLGGRRGRGEKNKGKRRLNFSELVLGDTRRDFCESLVLGVGVLWEWDCGKRGGFDIWVGRLEMEEL